jgi:hypothetical protein
MPAKQFLLQTSQYLLKSGLGQNGEGGLGQETVKGRPKRRKAAGDGVIQDEDRVFMVIRLVFTAVWAKPSELSLLLVTSDWQGTYI